MDCLLRPKRPARLIERVPYVCKDRYDGEDWFSFPTRIGMSRMVDDPSNPYHLPYQFVEGTHPTPTKQQESNFQTWMFFGLISEALDGNVNNSEASSVVSDRPVAKLQARHSILDNIYDVYIIVEDDASYLTTSNLLLDLEQSWTISTACDREKLLARCKRLRLCLWKVYKFLSLTPSDFDLRIKCSISAIGEILSQLVRKVSNGVEAGPTGWGRHLYRKHVNWMKEIMLPLGWCPSDLSRCRDKFASLQMLNYLSMLDRSEPHREHDNCNNISCNAFTIDSAAYKIGHVEPTCSCNLFFVEGFRNAYRFAKALATPGSVPLLQIVGDISNLKVNIVEAKSDTHYVAISHVWADGLGNPNANALYRCQLIRLRSLVRSLTSTMVDRPVHSMGLSPLSEPLIWIDTMCCPVSPRKDKDTALAKMRQVYENAACVLVIDAGLQLHESQSMDLVEKIARVINSGWLRRLWTLQEGALAKCLYLQFADQAVSLTSLQREIKEASSNIRYQLIYHDFFGVYEEIRHFFHDRSSCSPSLNVLSKALAHRGVTNPDDEAVCIGTLMSLPVEKILEETGLQRKKIMWMLLMEKVGALSSPVIFYEDERVDIPGWRWAPKSMLNVKAQLLYPEHRFFQSSDTRLGIQTPWGLQVRYPGFRLNLREPGDIWARQPWLDEFQMPEELMLFRDSVSKKWFTLKNRSGKRQEANDTSTGVKLREKIKEMAQSGGCLIIMEADYSEKPEIRKLYTAPGADTTFTVPVRGVVVSLVQATNEIEPLFQSSEEGALRVHTAIQVEVGPVDNVQNEFYNIIEHCALHLRSDPTTTSWLSSANSNTEEWKAGLRHFQRQIEELIAHRLEEDPALNAGIRSLFGDDSIEHLWGMALLWFNMGDFIGSRLSDDQTWLVD